MPRRFTGAQVVAICERTNPQPLTPLVIFPLIELPQKLSNRSWTSFASRALIDYSTFITRIYSQRHWCVSKLRRLVFLLSSTKPIYVHTIIRAAKQSYDLSYLVCSICWIDFQICRIPPWSLISSRFFNGRNRLERSDHLKIDAQSVRPMLIAPI